MTIIHNPLVSCQDAKENVRMLTVLKVQREQWMFQVLTAVKVRWVAEEAEDFEGESGDKENVEDGDESLGSMPLNSFV